jgi:hypothetical protein
VFLLGVLSSTFSISPPVSRIGWLDKNYRGIEISPSHSLSSVSTNHLSSSIENTLLLSDWDYF